MEKSNFNNSGLNKMYGKSRGALYLKMNKKANPVTCSLDLKIIRAASKEKKSRIAFYNSRIITGNTINSGLKVAIRNSFVIRLTERITQNFNTITGCARPDNIFSDEFYKSCMNNLSGASLANVVNDSELLLLYLKQLALILRNASVFDNTKEFVTAKNSSPVYLYLKILDSFWNKVNWDELFPSMPEAAKSLKAAKNVLINLMLMKKDKFRLDRISNTFFKITGLGRTNDLLLISFLDFGFFTWLGHFGIINYLDGDDADPVTIELTEHGRKILEYLAQ